MTCKLSSLFNSGEDFDDEDLLGPDWPVPSASGPADVAAAASSCALRASSGAHRAPENTRLQRTGERPGAPCSGPAPGSSTHAAAGQTVALGLRPLPSSAQPPHAHPPTRTDSRPVLASQQSCARPQASLEPPEAPDEFDDWDVDLADLDECDGHMGQVQPPAAAPSVPTAKSLRPPTCGAVQTRPGPAVTQHTHARQPLGSSNRNLPLYTPPASLVRSPASCPPQSPGVFPGLRASSAAPSPVSRTHVGPQQLQRSWETPRPSFQARSLFETISPARPSPLSVGSSSLSPHPLHTPVLTNRLVQLVSASNKLPKKRPCSEPHRLRTRRFPGPAGLLPQQPQGHSLDEIVVSNPQTPAHGVVARLPSQGSGSQADEDEFSGGAWAAMKAETGLDERNASCFLHSYSVVMVLRKAALKQLAKNKVPNMAVLLKSIIHTHADAKAVFKDPTGEIQGTVHRRLLEDRAEELKVGAVLLLKQVGVFSPSHRNHYLNVTSNNLLRIYDPDGVSLSSTQLPPFCLEPVCSSPTHSATVLAEPVSWMRLMFDEEDDVGQAEAKCTGGEDPRAPADARLNPREPSGNLAPQNPGWDADDDLDELLGELPDDTYSF